MPSSEPCSRPTPLMARHLAQQQAHLFFGPVVPMHLRSVSHQASPAAGPRSSPMQQALQLHCHAPCCDRAQLQAHLDFGPLVAMHLHPSPQGSHVLLRPPPPVRHVSSLLGRVILLRTRRARLHMQEWPLGLHPESDWRPSRPAQHLSYVPAQLSFSPHSAGSVLTQVQQGADGDSISRFTAWQAWDAAPMVTSIGRPPAEYMPRGRQWHMGEAAQ